MFVDGGQMYPRRGAKTSLDNIIEMSIYFDDEEEHDEHFHLKKE